MTLDNRLERTDSSGSKFRSPAKILPSRLYIDICSSDLRGLQNAEVTKPALEDLKVCGTLVKDAVQLLGQVDVHLTQCRELRYGKFLCRSFRAVLKSGQMQEKRFADNKIFWKDLDKIVRSQSSIIKKVSCGQS